jgi:hypothetical protein
MAFLNGAGVKLGSPTVVAEQNRGHSMEFYADQAIKRILGSASSRHPHLHAQAQAFKDEMRVVILETLQRAIRSDRLTLAGELKKCGYETIAEQIRSHNLRTK